jgi:hypothetical protein
MGEEVSDMTWKGVLGLEGQDVDFEMVHMRYRAAMMESPPINDINEINKLNWAFEEARKELATGRREDISLNA